MDIWALMEDGSKPVHFLGPLVCTLPPRPPGNSSAFQLIDGQQRITTLTILLSAIRDVARSRGLSDFAEEVTEDYLLFKRKQGSDRYKVLPRLGDREVLTAMIEGLDMSAFSDSGVYEAWKYFHRHVQHLSRNDTHAQLRKLATSSNGTLATVVAKSTLRTRAFRFATKTTGRSNMTGSAIGWRISNVSCSLGFWPWKVRRCRTRTSDKRWNSANCRLSIGELAHPLWQDLLFRFVKAIWLKVELSADSRHSTMVLDSVASATHPTPAFVFIWVLPVPPDATSVVCSRN